MPDKEIAALSGAHLRGTRFVYVAASFAALGDLLFGYDTGVISGALIFIKREFGLTTTAEEIVVSGVLLGATIAMTILAMSLIDRAGRRPLLLVGIAGMIITLGVLGLSFRISNPSGQLAWIAVICLMGYVASFAISLGPIFWLLIAEIYPLKIRSLAEGTAAPFNWASNLIVSLTFLTLVEKLGASSTFLLYAFASAASWLFAYYFVPETRGRTLEEIEAFWRARHHVRQTGN
jgi:MFS family permease